MNTLTRISAILIISSLLVSGCGAAPTSAPLATATSIPTVVQPKAADSATGIIAVVPVAEGPIGLAATADSIWVEAHRADIVTRIDPLQNIEVARLEDVPVHCQVVSSGDFVWAAHAHVDRVTKLDAASGAVVGSIKLGDSCGLAADETDLWVTSPGYGKLVRYDAATLEQRAVISLGINVFGVELGPDAVWAVGEADGGTVWRIDPATNQVVTSFSISDPYIIGIEDAFDFLWVGSRNKGVIYRIDPATYEVTETIKVNNSIGGIGVGPDAIWATGFGDGTIYKIDPATNTVTGLLSTHFWKLGPPLVAFDSIWVGALDQNVVLRIDPVAFDGSTATTP